MKNGNSYSWLIPTSTRSALGNAHCPIPVFPHWYPQHFRPRDITRIICRFFPFTPPAHDQTPTQNPNSRTRYTVRCRHCAPVSVLPFILTSVLPLLNPPFVCCCYSGFGSFFFKYFFALPKNKSPIHHICAPLPRLPVLGLRLPTRHPTT
ncbi:hypothetical protein BC828DRAFT_386446 [Blastocladiella britannica]|nr:hypothetical protein BC828DRAFT_386446 [Blastocladiella britannica]